MVLCGVCISMFTLAVFLDVLTRTLGAPWLWLQQVTTAFFASFTTGRVPSAATLN